MLPTILTVIFGITIFPPQFFDLCQCLVEIVHLYVGDYAMGYRFRTLVHPSPTDGPSSAGPVVISQYSMATSEF